MIRDAFKTRPPRKISAAATLQVSDSGAFCNATTAAFTVTLPAAAAMSGQSINAIKTDSSANVVTVKGAGSELINAANTTTLTAQYQAVELLSDGTQWFIAAKS